MNKNNLIAASFLATIHGMLPQIEYDAQWAGTTGYFEPILNQFDASTLEEGVVYASTDDQGRRLFIVNHMGKANMIFERYAPDETVEYVKVMFQGQRTVGVLADIDSDCDTIYLQGLCAFFAFFGPETVHALVVAEIEKLEKLEQLAAVAEAASANDDIVAPAHESIDNAARLRAAIDEQHAAETAAAPEADAAVEPTPANETVERTVTIVKIDTPIKKAAVIGGVTGVIGLALYGAWRLARG